MVDRPGVQERVGVGEANMDVASSGPVAGPSVSLARARAG
jgi:hypothetical protein